MRFLIFALLFPTFVRGSTSTDKDLIIPCFLAALEYHLADRDIQIPLVDVRNNRLVVQPDASTIAFLQLDRESGNQLANQALKTWQDFETLYGPSNIDSVEIIDGAGKVLGSTARNEGTQVPMTSSATRNLEYALNCFNQAIEQERPIGTPRITASISDHVLLEKFDLNVMNFPTVMRNGDKLAASAISLWSECALRFEATGITIIKLVDRNGVPIGTARIPQ